MRNLKKWLFPGCVLAVLGLGTVSALHSKPNPNFVITGESSSFDLANYSQSTIQPSGKMVTIALTTPGSTLRNYGTVNINQFCAPKASIEIDSALLAALDQDLLAQGLIKMPREFKIDEKMPAIVFNSQTSMSDVENNGTGYIKIQCPNTAHIKVSNRGMGQVNVLTSYIESAQVENLGMGLVTIPDIKQEIKIFSAGTGNVAVGAAAKADVKLMGVGSVSFTNSPQLTSAISGVGVVKINEPHPYN